MTVLRDGQPFFSWRVEGDDEFITIRRFAQYLRAHLELPVTEWNPTLFEPSPSGKVSGVESASHPMGGATMGIDPRSSVVDPNMRVHGLRNLFIASTAVFPDGSPHFPTLPLMALSLRLAQHLHKIAD